MSEEKMPAAEAEVVEDDVVTDDERNHYELAFHVLPTVAEGEVEGVFEALKAILNTEGAELTDEEAPERIDLAYEIDKMIEGKHRKFTSAYFGWVRFKVAPESIANLTEEIDSRVDILRYLLLKLTKLEEAHSFRFHEAHKNEKMVTTVEESAVVPDLTTADHAGESSEDKKEDDTEEAGDVKEEELEESLDKLTGENAETEEEKA